MTNQQQQQQQSSPESDSRQDDSAWLVSFTAAMIPFTSFCYFHSKGGTGRVVEAVVRSPVGVYGLLALPFVTLGMEKCVYDTAQAAQGINPCGVKPNTGGGFPSGGAALPSFSLVPVQKENVLSTTKAWWVSSSSSNNDNNNNNNINNNAVDSLMRRTTAQQK